MADDRDARIAQLEAEVRQLRAEVTAASARESALAEVLEQQAATADILRVIASGPTDAQAVLEVVVERAARLTSSPDAFLELRDADHMRFVAMVVNGVASAGNFEVLPLIPTRPAARALLERKTIHVPRSRRPCRRCRIPGHHNRSARASLSVPLIRQGEAIGVLSAIRPLAGTFSARQIALLETFADQAVIAIENARLFGELQERTRELAQSVEELRPSARSVRPSLRRSISRKS